MGSSCPCTSDVRQQVLQAKAAGLCEIFHSVIRPQTWQAMKQTLAFISLNTAEGYSPQDHDWACSWPGLGRQSHQSLPEMVPLAAPAAAALTPCSVHGSSCARPRLPPLQGEMWKCGCCSCSRSWHSWGPFCALSLMGEWSLPPLRDTYYNVEYYITIYYYIIVLYIMIL